MDLSRLEMNLLTTASDLISREALKAELCAMFPRWDERASGVDEGLSLALEALRKAPSIAAEPVVEAHWEMINMKAAWIPEYYETGEFSWRRMPYCSQCHHRFGTSALEYKRCPECGAHISGVRDRNDVVYVLNNKGQYDRKETSPYD